MVAGMRGFFSCPAGSGALSRLHSVDLLDSWQKFLQAFIVEKAVLSFKFTLIAECLELQTSHPLNLFKSTLRPGMIVLKISNASEVVASKVGKFLERLTPDSIDHTTVEDQVIKKMIENLAAEGIKGEIAAINGLDLDGDDLSLHKELKVRKHTTF